MSPSDVKKSVLNRDANRYPNIDHQGRPYFPEEIDPFDQFPAYITKGREDGSTAAEGGDKK